MAKDTGRSEIPTDERDDEEGGEVDVLFRAQMTVTNFLLGYWKHMLGVLGIVLAGVYGYSYWTEHSRDHQRELQAAIQKVTLDVPQPDQMALMGLAPMDDPADTERVAALKKSAEDFEVVAKGGSGTGAVMAWMEAAKLWERAGDASRAKIAWKAAYDLKPQDILAWSTGANYASSLANEGDIDGAAAVYRAFADDPKADGYIAERALYELGQLFEGSGRIAESQQAYTEFTTRFPNSDLSARVAEASRRIRDAG